jgi:hypothetical protein
MSEEDKEKDADRVKPLEVKPGGKEKGTRMAFWEREDNDDKK